MSTRGKDVRHRGGVAWYEAPIPPWWHRCRAQTTALIVEVDERGITVNGGLADASKLSRCACGAIKWEDWFWRSRNERLKEKRRNRRVAAHA